MVILTAAEIAEGRAAFKILGARRFIHAEVAEALEADAARWRHFSQMTCGEQRWACACADKTFSQGAVSLEEYIDAAIAASQSSGEANGP